MNQRTLIMKFGGTSVGTPGAMAEVVKIVKETQREWPRCVVVISALSKVTNLLLESVAQAARGDVEACAHNAPRLRELHEAIIAELILAAGRAMAVRHEIEGLIGEFAGLCQAVGVLGEATPRAIDAVASLGERMSVRLLAAALESAGQLSCYVEASDLIVTDECFQNAHPDFEASAQKMRSVLDPILDGGQVPVVTGFIGATRDGVVTTLGRGGSDYSAGLLGALLPAEEVWIWTDVDGVMSADPRLAPEARTIAEISYREIAELAYYGAKVLHPKTIRPVVEAGVALRICNTFNPEHPGTRLVVNGDSTRNGSKVRVAKAVTAIRAQRLITIEGRGMLGVPGVAARAFGAVAATGTSVPLITQSSSEQSICFLAPEGAVKDVLASLEKAFVVEIANRDIDRVWATGEVAIITVVGTGMQYTSGVAGRIFSSLGEAEINVLAIAQGSSDVSISLVVEGDEAEAAVRALHQLIVMA